MIREVPKKNWAQLEVSVSNSLYSTIAYELAQYRQHIFFVFSIIFNIPRFFELYTEMETRNSTIFNETLGENVTTEITVPAVLPTELRKNSDYSFGYVLITNSVALGFIPMVGLVVLNSLIFRTINQATQRHNAISSNQRRDHSVSSQYVFSLLNSITIIMVLVVITTITLLQASRTINIKTYIVPGYRCLTCFRNYFQDHPCRGTRSWL